ncbi:MAG: hypothetical protein ACPG5U_06540 [Planktomarina sp.]
MWRWLGLLVLASPLQAETLADVQRDIDSLLSDISGMLLELTLSREDAPALTGTLMDRVSGVEEELRKLIGMTERLEFQVRQLGKNATLKVQDLQFRLCSLDPDCDEGVVQAAPDLSVQAPVVTPSAAPVVGQSEFDAATAAFVNGDMDTALAGIDGFLAKMPSGALVQNAHLLRGRILRDQNQATSAARAFLTAYIQGPRGADAADALYELGTTFHRMAKAEEGCLTLAEVESQFPDTEASNAAGQAIAELGCE